MIRAALLWLCLATAAAAQDLPALHSVTGVAPDDVLNVRAEPDGRATIVGTLAPDARDVEVVEERDGWGRVNVAERAGWASLRYLARQPGQVPQGLLDIRQCFGTEPFWSLSVDDRARTTWREPGEPDREGVLPGRFKSQNRRDIEGIVVHLFDGAEIHAVLQRALCSDGMSDRLYGLTVTLFMDQARGGKRLLSGCCSLQPD